MGINGEQWKGMKDNEQLTVLVDNGAGKSVRVIPYSGRLHNKELIVLKKWREGLLWRRLLSNMKRTPLTGKLLSSREEAIEMLRVECYITGIENLDYGKIEGIT